MLSNKATSSSFSGTSKKTLRTEGRNRYINVFGWLILILAYGFLIPGLLLPLYRYLIQGVPVEKTMWTTIEFVQEHAGLGPALIVAFFGIAVPAIKLVLVAIAHMRDLPWASRLVVWVSKWAIVDALAASFIMAYYANAYDGAITARIETGYIFFVLYCVLSTMAALILDDRDEEFTSMYASRKFFVENPWIERKSTSIYALATAAGLSFTSMLLYTLRIGMEDDVVSMSILSACNRLATEIEGDVRPMVVILLFVVIIPIIELMYMGFMLYRPVDNFYSRCALRCLPQCGLMDVYAVSIPVLYIFLNPLGTVIVEIPPLGFILLCAAIISTAAARFLLNRYLSRLFSGSLAESKSAQTVIRQASNNSNSTTSSGVSVIAV
jgi:uncharacterized paraquat-inducible protein A